MGLTTIIFFLATTICQGLMLKDAHLRLEKLEAQSKCGALVAFMNDLNGSKRCIKLATVTTKRSASVATDSNVKELQLSRTHQ
jgi:hypothetical protein